jgi:hypothetical protein
MSEKNMITKHLKSWAKFKPEIDKIRRTYEYSIGNDQTHKQKNTILFRGQASAKWPLQTTLERNTNRIFTFGQYLLVATQIVNELESYLGIKLDVNYESLREEKVEKSDDLFGIHLPLKYYEYLVYLRHHGYPSPLLDWSESPYIAAYFAMCDANPKEKRVAVFAYIEKNINTLKDFSGKEEPKIQVEGPYITTHKRHFVQQAQYTIASKWSEEHRTLVFCSHHEIFDKQRPNQDILIKITIPVADRKLALKDLNDYNINHFTLFQTEDSLIRALSVKNFDID